MEEPALVPPTMEQIARWQGVQLPNATARHGLGEMQGLIDAMAKLRNTMVFEDEPSSFEAALRDCKEQEA